jgi:hypothetical protein
MHKAMFGDVVASKGLAAWRQVPIAIKMSVLGHAWLNNHLDVCYKAVFGDSASQGLAAWRRGLIF